MARHGGTKAARPEFEAARQKAGAERQRVPFCVPVFLRWVPAFLPWIPAFLLFCLPASPASPQQPSLKRGSAELGVLPVVVTDKQGKFVSDLTTDQFAVFDNGRRM